MLSKCLPVKIQVKNFSGFSVGYSKRPWQRPNKGKLERVSEFNGNWDPGNLLSYAGEGGKTGICCLGNL
jgi:hypothetical protein